MRKKSIIFIPASYDGSFRSALVGQFLMASKNIAGLSDFSSQFNWTIIKANDSIIVIIKEFRVGCRSPAGDAPFGYKCDFHIYISNKKYKKIRSKVWKRTVAEDIYENNEEETRSERATRKQKGKALLRIVS